MSTETIPPGSQPKRRSQFSRVFGFIPFAGMLGVVLYLLIFEVTATSPPWDPIYLLGGWIILPGFVLLFLAYSVPEAFPSFLAKRTRLRMTFYMVGGVLIACGFGVILFASSPSDGKGVDVALIIFYLAVTVFAVWGLNRPARRADRERRQNLLAQIEALAEKDPNLYIVAQLVRDDIAISSRQSGRQGILQNTFFFLAGLAVPYFVQYVGPYIQSLPNVR